MGFDLGLNFDPSGNAVVGNPSGTVNSTSLSGANSARSLGALSGGGTSWLDYINQGLGVAITAATAGLNIANAVSANNNKKNKVVSPTVPATNWTSIALIGGVVLVIGVVLIRMFRR